MRNQLHHTFFIVPAVVLLIMLSGPTFPAEGENLERVTLLVEKGNPVQGKKHFQDLLCTSCHRVAGEKTFPKPISGYEGPIIDSKQAVMPTGEISASILMPSHRIPKEVRQQMRGETSPMTDYSDAITVRQLMDLIAYIQSLK